MDTLVYLSYPLAAIIIPLVCFSLGVQLSIVIKRHPDISPKMLRWMSIPVGLLIVGANMSNASITMDTTTTFAYLETPGKLLTSMGITIFYGVLTPSLFEAYLSRLETRAVADNQA
ncbi:MAG: hypothetical protein AAFU41_08600 [Pseudomonadota bacterium]